jgi:hypothetical protein
MTESTGGSPMATSARLGPNLRMRPQPWIFLAQNYRLQIIRDRDNAYDVETCAYAAVCLNLFNRFLRWTKKRCG